MGIRWIRRHSAVELTLTHGTRLGGDDFWDGRRRASLANLRSSCLQMFLKAWLSHLYTSDSWGHVGSMLIFSFPLFYQCLAVSSFLIHSCVACHKNSFDLSTDYRAIHQYILWWFHMAVAVIPMSSSVFLLVLIRPVWFLRQVGCQRG